MLGLGQSHYDKPSLMLFNVFANENSPSIWTIPLLFEGLIGTLNYGLTTETSFYLDNILHFTPTPRNKKNLDKSI